MTLRAQYEAGDALMTIAKRNNLSKSVVRRRIIANGGSMRKHYRPKTIYPEVAVLYRQGKPRRAILEAVGCSAYAYAESLRAAGIIPDFRKKERTT